MTRLARLSLANRSLVIMIAVVLTGIGAYVIPQLKQQLFPSLSLPMATVASGYAGASPQIVEEQVTKPIENSLKNLDGAEEVTSTSSEGMSQVRVAFDYDRESDEIVSDIQEAVNKVEAELPDDVEPRVIAGSTDDIPVVALAVSNGDDSDDGEAKLLDKLETTVVPELESVDNVKEAQVTGARAEQVTITPDTEEMTKKGLSPTAIPTALEANGVSVPAGTLTEGDKSMSVQVGESLKSVEDIENLYLTPGASASGGQSQQGGGGQAGGQAGGQQGGAAAAKPVKLGSVAEVKKEPETATSITRTNGKESLGISVTMTSDGNAVNISHDIDAKLDDLKDTLGDEVEMSVIFDQAPSVEKSIDDLTTEGGLGLLFAVLVIMIFLLSLRSTLVTAVSIPLSVVIALISLWIGDYSLNMLTLGALTISVGRVVDDAIVVLENIKRHLSYGEAKREAVINGVREVSGAVTSSTLTTVAVFLPIAFVSGMVGQLFSSFAITVTVALLASLIVSLTVVPVLAYWFLKAPKGDKVAEVRAKAEERELRSPLQRMYVPVLRFATRFKAVTILIGIGVLVGTFALIPGLKTNFLDSSGQDTTQMSQTLPVATSLGTTDKAVEKVEEILAEAKDDGDLKSYQVSIGGGNAFFGGVGAKSNKANYTITVADASKTPQVEKDLRDKVEDLSGVGEITVGAQGGAEATGGNAVEVIVKGSDTDSLEEAASQVEGVVEDVKGTSDVTSNLEDAAPRVQVTADKEKAAKAGLTEQAIGQFVAQQVHGAPVGEITINDTASDIILAGDDKPADIGEIKDLKIPTATGEKKLSDVAKVEKVDSPAEISHIDGDRTATVSAVADVSDLGAITTDLNTELKDLDLPEGTSYEVAGSSQDQEEAFADLGLAMLIAIALVFMVMVATFRSFVQPLILLVSIPFAATGAIGMLKLTDVPLGVPGMIGLLMLIGIVVTNAIVLIDLINQYRAQGMGIREAVIAGGRRRLRPILMTAIATIMALIPMAIGVTGSGGFIAQSLAIVVIGGLVSSTLLTLLLVPALYTMVERIKERFRRKPKSGDDAAAPQSKPEPAAVG
ncbi:efflux RND transporter permease subunit [Stackebrandtia nassauensis]|uniref:Acriflavin resistance protein n=1 Tax=Stackebrandtia nassauensis (strain DSM 44728 / CIP 108903 / NRRL B-16338 / NBRC 102104 / LLR-40K-21) TaxID=446470 RepID=D3QBG0_STANL|nr:efflux RND transporter permease subunit [Stackebrandtia nassauensis]ADD42842.1 acriflavin resistance protein [Stackebrandtia nassauensis DSM 44728]